MFQVKAEQLLDPAENITIQQLSAQGPEQPHTHEFIELIYISGGSGVQYINDCPYPVQRGSMLFLNYRQTHQSTRDGEMTYYNFLLKPEFMSETLINSVDAFALLALAAFSDFQNIQDSPPVAHFSGREMLEIEQIAASAYQEFQKKEAGYRTVLKGYMTVLFTRLFRHMALPVAADEQSSGRAIAPEILAYIEEHCYEKITLAELAQKSFYNPSYFSRIFKEYSGQSLTDYIHKKRVERARFLLESSDNSVEEICAAVGYSDKKQFYKQFRQYTGTTPGHIRKSGGKGLSAQKGTP